MSLLRALTRNDFTISKLCLLIAICTQLFCSCNSSSSGGATQDRTEKVIVVGAGVSGLIAALHLEENGIEVTILEKEPRVGGRVYSEPLGGTYANLGAQYFFETGNSYLDDYISRARANSISPRSGMNGFLWDGLYVASEGEEYFYELPIDLMAWVDLDRAYEQMATDAFPIWAGREFFFDKTPASQAWSELDNRSAGEYLSEFHPDVTTIFDCLLIPELGVAADNASALLLVGGYGVTDDGESGGGRLLVEGGNQKLTETIAEDIEQLGGTINLSTEVTEIVDTGSGVQVQCSNGTVYEADYAIVTTPATVTKNIVAGLSEEKREALDAVTYAAAMQVGLHITNLPYDEIIASCMFHNENLHAHIEQGGEGQMDNETVISLNITGEEFHALDDDEIIQRVSETLGKIYPSFDSEESIEDYAIKKWTDGIVKFTPGLMDKYQEALRAPSGRIFFAGDYTHDPALSGASWSGVRAAEQIIGVLP